MKPGRFIASVLVSFFALAPPAVAQTVFPTGTTIWVQGSTADGFTVYPAEDGTAKVVDIIGNLIHEYVSPDEATYGPLGNAEPLVHAPGHILVFASEFIVPGTSPRASVLLELDWDGTIVWEFSTNSPTLHLHHDFERLPNGNTLILCSQEVTRPEISALPLIDDCIFEVTPAGQVVWTWATADHFDQFGFTDEAKALISAAGGDWAHANAVSTIPANTHTDPAFKQGNLIVSYRGLNTIIIIDRNTKQIVWKVGPDDNLTIGQHQPEMLKVGMAGAGNILVFDNGGLAGYPSKTRLYSRVLEINPVTKTIAWQYDATKNLLETSKFFSSFISGAQRLLNGNTLIDEGAKGRFFEIKAGTNEIVWEYMNPFAGPTIDLGVTVDTTRVYRAFRTPQSWIPVPPPAR